jgi:hypothetical protein
MSWACLYTQEDTHATVQGKLFGFFCPDDVKTLQGVTYSIFKNNSFKYKQVFKN